jgi:hypothetical protein
VRSSEQASIVPVEVKATRQMGVAFAVARGLGLAYLSTLTALFLGLVVAFPVAVQCLGPMGVAKNSPLDP